MVVLTGSDTYFTNVDSSFTATKWEACIDQAIDKINGYARTALISNMTGAVAGSKTVTLTSMQAGYVRTLAVAIYQKDVTSAGAQSSSFGLGALQTSQSASANSGAEVESLAEAAARNLTEYAIYRT